MPNFKIFGRVSDANSGKAIPYLRVEVWDKDPRKDDLCGSAQTNRRGVYSVEFDEKVFWDSNREGLPDIYLKIFDGDKLLETTEVQKDVSAGETEINAEVEMSPESTTKTTSKSKSKSKAKTARKASSSSSTPSKTVTPEEESPEPEKQPAILATGLEDYGRWKAMFKDHKSESDKPFRRGRIWA